jgi:hypothetical protein
MGGHLRQGRDKPSNLFHGPLPDRDKAFEAARGHEKAELRTIVADLSLDKEMLQDVISRKL